MQLQALVASLALLGTAHASGIYSKNSPVLQVNAKNYDKLIAKSNYTSIVEFYAPWCGHCKNLKPAYEKAATNLAGLAHVAAIDCDTDANKPFCSSMDVRGFPTLKIVRPAKRAGGAPIVDDYNGPRTATGIVEAVVDKINNHVRRVTDAEVAEFLGERAEGPKALLFTEKGTTSPLLKSIAIDFLDVIAVGQIRSKEAETVARFGVTSFPTLVLLPGGDKEPIVYEGEMKKASIVKFLSQAGDPNPDPAPSKSDKNKAKKAKEAAEEPAAEEPIVVEPVEEPEVNEAPPQEQQPAPITTLMTTGELTTACLHPKAGTCVFALVPEEKHETADALLEALAELVHKNEKAGRALLFPLYAVPAVNPSHAALAAGLGVSGEVEVVAVNAKRGWWKHYQGDLSPGSVTEWVDDIRMGEGAKSRLPEGIVVDPATGSEAEAETQAETQAETVESEEAAADTRDEL